MRMNEIDFEGPPPVDGYGAQGFRVAGTWHEGGLILAPSGITPLATLDAAALAPLATASLDIVLIGMGAEIAPLPGPLRVLFEEAGIGVEIMSTPSACRTYNVLLTERRRVGAALLPTSG